MYLFYQDVFFDMCLKPQSMWYCTYYVYLLNVLFHDTILLKKKTITYSISKILKCIEVYTHIHTHIYNIQCLKIDWS